MSLTRYTATQMNKFRPIQTPPSENCTRCVLYWLHFVQRSLYQFYNTHCPRRRTRHRLSAHIHRHRTSLYKTQPHRDCPRSYQNYHIRPKSYKPYNWPRHHQNIGLFHTQRNWTLNHNTQYARLYTYHPHTLIAWHCSLYRYNAHQTHLHNISYCRLRYHSRNSDTHLDTHCTLYPHHNIQISQ